MSRGVWRRLTSSRPVRPAAGRGRAGSGWRPPPGGPATLHGPAPRWGPRAGPGGWPGWVGLHDQQHRREGLGGRSEFRG